MVIMNRVAPPVANQILPVEVIQGLMAMVAGARAIEAWLANSNRDLNSLGGTKLFQYKPLFFLRYTFCKLL
jgi:hypothetical protein